MRTGWLLTGLLAAVVAAGSAESEDDAPIADREIGLSKTSPREVPDPDPVVPNETDPGEGPALEPSYEGFPLRISHGVADHLPITLAENACIDCHAVEEKVEGEATPIPQSHYVDLRRAPDETREEVAGARYVCTSCHVPATSAAPLVENRHTQ